LCIRPRAAAAAAFAGGENEEFSGRCSAILANGKRCPNAAIPGSRFCGIPAHRELAEREARGETLEASQVVGGVSDEAEEEAPAEETGAAVEPEPVAETPPVEEATEEAPPAPEEEPAPEEPAEAEEPAAEAEPEEPVEPQEAPAEPEVAVAVEETPSEEEDEPSAA
jgi:N utilization substance protein A